MSLDALAFDPRSKSYAVGPSLFSLAGDVLARGRVLDRLRIPMENLAHRYAITVVLWRVIDQDHLRLAAFAVSDADVHIRMRIGQRLPSWSGAVGRLMAGFSKLPERELKARFESVHWQNRPSFRQYLEQAREAIERGYGTDEGNFARSVMSLAVPIFDREMNLVLACGAVMFMGQHSGDHLKKIAEELKALVSSVDPEIL